ncbi:MAG: hypothetical protein A2W85_03380 [Bacteroidetes bacterium GWF2_41_31]|nr:MAG: hypothetical protein A2W85_03380 [Bacteroidetes bacterium GWF2_41_31]OFZ09338.1 MAG: hypothetical protein A2338_09835 [Bacteroidetes bacterium RIFOXYB12_FULL_41_6]
MLNYLKSKQIQIMSPLRKVKYSYLPTAGWNPLKGTLDSSLIFNEFPFRGHLPDGRQGGK